MTGHPEQLDIHLDAVVALAEETWSRASRCECHDNLFWTILDSSLVLEFIRQFLNLP